jgi:hypothetical protein
MADPTPPADHPSESICPWCSATVAPDSPTCPSCGAILGSDEERDVPGVTAVDIAAIRAESKPATRNRLLSWISGEYPEQPPTADETQALAPPDADVQREIMRLELEAEVANLQAETDALLADAVVEGRVGDLPAAIQPLATGEFDAGALAAATAAGEVGAPVATEPVAPATPAAPHDKAIEDDEVRPV